MKHGILAFATAGLLLAGICTNMAWAQTAPAAPPAAAPIMGAPPHTLGSAAPAQPTPGQTFLPQTASAPADQDRPPAGQRETAALNLLEAQGYGNFTDFRADGANFTATVNNPDGSYAVQVNPDSGQVIRR